MMLPLYLSTTCFFQRICHNSLFFSFPHLTRNNTYSCLNADVYSLEIIIPIAFRLNTYYTHVFRSWLLRKAYAKEQKDTYMLFVPILKGGHC